MRESSYIRMPAGEVLKLCERRLELYRTQRANSVVRCAKLWRRRWLYRLEVWLGWPPCLDDEVAARKWCSDNWSSLETWGRHDVEQLKDSAKLGHEMFLSVQDYDLIKDA